MAMMLIKLLNYSIQAMIYYWFFDTILDSERRYGSGMAEFVAASDAIMLLDLLLNAKMPEVYIWAKLLINSTLIVLSIMLIFRVTLKKALITCYIPFLLLVAIAESLTFAAVGSLFHLEVAAVWEKSLPETVFIYLLADAAELMILLLAARFFGTGRLLLLSRKLLTVLLISFFFQTVAWSTLSYLIMTSRPIDSAGRILLLTMYLFSNLGAGYLLYSISQSRRLDRQKTAMEAEEALVQQQMASLYQENQKAEELQSDIVAAMQHLENIDQTEQLRQRYTAYRNLEYCDDVVLNTFLQSYEQRFSQKGIQCKYQFDCSVADSLDDMDLVKVFSNLLDNAMEAVQNNPAGARSIRVSVRQAANLYQIAVINDLPQKMVQIVKKVQGEGLKIVREIAAANHGEVRTYQDSSYHAEVTYQAEAENHEQA